MKPEYTKETQTPRMVDTTPIGTARRAGHGHFMLAVDVNAMATALLEIHAAATDETIKPKARIEQIMRSLGQERL